MIQLQVLSGGEAGKRLVVDRFPFKVGRGFGNSLVLSDPGVFAEHFEITMTGDGFCLGVKTEAVVTVNEGASAGGVLKNGDVIGCGLARVQFWLGELPQNGLKLREMAAWGLVALVVGSQVYLLTRLLEMARS